MKTSSLGDILQSFPVASFLRQKSPYGEISWVVEEKFYDLVAAHPDVDRVIPIKRRFGIPVACHFRKHVYDVLFDLQGNCKSGFLTYLADAKAKVGFAWKDLPEKPNGLATNVKFKLLTNKTIREDYLFLAQSYFNDFSPFIPQPFLFPLSKEEAKEIENLGGTTLVCPGAYWESKRLTLMQWSTILANIKGPISFVWGSEEERKLVKQLESFGTVLPKLSLAQLQNVMAKSKKVISMDSLALHLCATTKTPVFAYFGPSSLNKFLPQNAHGIQGSCPFNVHFERRCPKLRSCEAPCIKNLDVSPRDQSPY